MTIKNAIMTMVGVLIFGMFIILLSTYATSYSGANKVLRTNGEITKTRIYDNDTLWYAPNSKIMSKQELKALLKTADHYTIIIE